VASVRGEPCTTPCRHRCGTGFVARLLEYCNIARAEVGEFATLGVLPDPIHQVEPVSLAGQAFDTQPGALAMEERLHLLRPMGGEAVPDDGHLAVVEELVQLGEVSMSGSSL
jgi:hypothetical protein